LWDTARRKIKWRMRVEGREEVSMGYEGRGYEGENNIVRERELLKERQRREKKQGKQATECREKERQEEKGERKI
jgi:hypothetical protein